MIWLLAAAGCSITIAIILKVNDVRGGNRVLLAGANYVVASLLALAVLGGKVSRPDSSTLALGTIAGIDYVLGFLLLMAGISRGPLAVPVTVMRLSVVVPIVFSIFVWKENPTSIQWGGIALGFFAIILFGAGLGRGGGSSPAGRDRGRGVGASIGSGIRRDNGGGASAGSFSGQARGGYWTFIVSLFLVMGIGDVLLKACRELSPGAERMLFTWILFTVAAVFTWLLILVRRIPVRRDTLLLGLLLGVPNLFSTIFTLRALETTPASIAFPFVNLTVILGTTLLAYIVWSERLRWLHLAGLAAAAAALVLLPLGG